MKGTLIWFNPAKRHGFIRTEDGERLLVNETGFAPGNVLGDHCRGTALSFDRDETSGEPCAVGVTIVPPFAARRARARKH